MQKAPISITTRAFLALGILLLDIVVVVIPLAAIFIMYVLIANPQWIHEFMDRLKE